MDPLDTTELVRTIVDQAHTIRLLHGELERLDGRLRALEASVGEAGRVPSEEPGPSAIDSSVGIANQSRGVHDGAS